MKNSRGIVRKKLLLPILLLACVLSGCKSDKPVGSVEKSETDNVIIKEMQEEPKELDANLEENETSGQTVLANDVQQEWQYTLSTVNVRNGPSTNAAILGLIEAGSQVKVDEMLEDGWSRVIWNDGESYIKTKYLSPEQPKEFDIDRNNIYSDKVIVIDAGHQKKANSEQEPVGPGAKKTKAKVASGTKGIVSNVPEYELNLDIALKLKKELQSEGFTVVMIREVNDVNISNAERAEVANAEHADAFIRIHANGSEDTTVNGIMTICQTPNNPYNAEYYEDSKLLSSAILEALIDSTKAKSKGIWETDTMSGINWCKVPVTIVEMGFMSNEEEDRLMQAEEYQDKLVHGLLEGLKKYFAELG